jgi:hypothetical protein
MSGGGSDAHTKEGTLVSLVPRLLPSGPAAVGASTSW